MLSTRIIGLACAVAVFVCLMAAPAAGQPLDKRTLFTFSGPITLPGVTLPAGQYLFRLADPNSSSKVVQVLNADGTEPYGLFFTLSAERFEPASTPEVRFMETASGTPAAVRTWWYPGERTGYEFIYPKEQARRLATAASQPVLTTEAQTTTTEQTNTADLSRVASGGQETDVSASAGGANCLVVAVYSDTVDSGYRQRAGGDANGISAERIISEWFRATHSHGAASDRNPASTRRDGGNSRALERGYVVVLAYATAVTRLLGERRSSGRVRPAA
jgi:hypothetical protein